jgi:hypothetical protein
MREACSLRGVCHELKKAVGDFSWEDVGTVIKGSFPWEDVGTVIKGSIAQWRACFPRARGANVWMLGTSRSLTPVVDADFVHFVGLRGLNMSRCTQVTDAAFEYLKGIQVLNMRLCRQATITGAAFEHLKGIQELKMSGCRQATITDAAFEHLKGILRC